MTPTVSQSVILEKLESVKCDVSILSETLKKVQDFLNEFRVDFEKRTLEVQHKAELNENRIIKVEQRIGAMEEETKLLKESVQRLYVITSIVSKVFWGLFIPIILGILAFIWAVMTHTITIQ